MVGERRELECEEQMTLIKMKLCEPHEFDPNSRDWKIYMELVEEQMKEEYTKRKLHLKLREALRGLRMGWRGELE